MGCHISFIGAGNMGGALACAVCRRTDPKQVLLCDHTAAKARALADQLGCRAGDLEEAARADIIFLGVKPYHMEELCGQLKSRIRPGTLLISMAAMVSLARMEGWLGGTPHILRILPNTPVKIGQGIVLWAPGRYLTEDECREALELLSWAGIQERVGESMMETASSVAGCSPAWTDMYIEAMADGGVACGLPRAQAMRLAAKAVAGAALLMLEDGRHPGALKDAVCSPGGTTIQGVRALEARGFRSAAMEAVIASVEASKR